MSRPPAPSRPGARPYGRPPRFSRPNEERRSDGHVLLYGLHTVEAALSNPRRVVHGLKATRNALARLSERGLAFPVEPEMVDVKTIDRLVPRDAVHQGVLLETEPLEPLPLKELGQQARLILALDQVTDPHNVGAILRSAVALGADAVITTNRHSPEETGVLAKAASGAVDLITHLSVSNLAKALGELTEEGFTAIALDSAGEADLEAVDTGAKTVLVMGSEGKGVRPGVRAACTTLARLDMPGAIRSLNVSNAAAIALFVVSRHQAARDK